MSVLKKVCNLSAMSPVLVEMPYRNKRRWKIDQRNDSDDAHGDCFLLRKHGQCFHFLRLLGLEML